MAAKETVKVADTAEVPPTVNPEDGKSKKGKAKKPSGSKTPRKPRTHPPYFEMIKDAIATLKERNGSSQYAIQKFIEEKHKQLPPNFRKLLLVNLRKLVAENKLVKVKNSYKLLQSATKPDSSSVAKKKPALAAKAKRSRPAAKPKAGAVKPKLGATKPSNPKTAAKSKPKAGAVKRAERKKPAAKARPAAKPKPAAKEKVTSAAAAKPKAASESKPKKSAKVARTATRSAPGKKKVTAAAAKKSSARRTPVRRSKRV